MKNCKNCGAPRDGDSKSTCCKYCKTQYEETVVRREGITASGIPMDFFGTYNKTACSG